MDLAKAYASRASVDAWTTDDAPSTFTETVRAAFTLTAREELSSSAARAFAGQNEQRAQVIGELGGDVNLAREYAWIPVRTQLREDERNGIAPQGSRWWTSLTPREQAAYRQQREFEHRFPDRVADDAALLDAFAAEAAELRKREHFVLQRGGGFAAFLGTGGAIMTDPLVIATLPLGGGSLGAGRSLLGTALRTGAIEGSIAAAVEIPIQAEVLRFKRAIDSPWTFKDSALNVLAAAGGGFGLGALIGGGAAGGRRLLERYREAKAAGRVQPTPELDEAERILEETARLHDENPLDLLDTAPEEPHERAIDTARAQAEGHRPVDVREAVEPFEPQDGLGRVLARAEDPAELVDIDPLSVSVDARTFQFKAGATEAGELETLRDVTRFDRRLAGVALIWERADGVRFIADGHQRLALAKRALAAGQAPDEVRLNGFVLREADGITAVDARRMAAVKNMAEGSGTAIDAAKILRGIGPAGEAMLPPLPPRSALVRQARGLANLGEDEFMAVVNGAVDARFGALVGAATTDTKLQSAMIQVLKRTAPANETQAAAIVGQVKTQGLEVRTTEDLFGEQAIAESLYLERAQVLDTAMREARKDRATFGRLVSEETRITGTGENRLDRAANEARIQEARNAQAKLTALANAKGPISDALTEAARALKGGARPADAARAFLEAARREIRRGDRGGRQARGARRGGAAPEPAARVAGQGPAEIADELDPDAPNFGIVEQHVLPEGDPRLVETRHIATPERTELRNRLVDEHFAGRTPRAEGERPVAYVMAGGGASGKGTVKRYLRERGLIPEASRVVDIDPDEIKAKLPEYGELLRAGDSRAAAIVHEESSDLAKAVLERAGRERFDIVFDRTLGATDKARADIEALRAAGYEVRVIGVTVDADAALTRMVQRYNRSGRFVPPKALIMAHAGFSRGIVDITELADDLLLFDTNVARGEAPRLVARKDPGGGGLSVEDHFLYNRFRAKEALNGAETTLREIHRKTVERQRTGSDVRRPGVRARDGGQAGRGAPAARAHPLDDIPEPELERALADARQLVDDQGDLLEVAELELDELGQAAATTRPARDALNELDELERAHEHVGFCTFGRSAA